MQLFFYGWSASSAHFVAIVANFPSQCNSGYRFVVWGLSPLLNEESQSAEEIVELFSYVLALNVKRAKNGVAIIGDNCATNRLVLRSFEGSFVGCTSHRFQLEMKGIMTEQNDCFDAIADLSKKRSNLLKRAMLRNHM